MSASYKTAKDERKEQRRRMYAKVHIIWTQLRPDLKKGTQDYKDGLYIFAEAELKKPQIGSLTELTLFELSRLIQALEREQSQPRLYGASDNVLPFTPDPRRQVADQQTAADVQHLA